MERAALPDAERLARILDVSRQLARPVEIEIMLEQIVEAARAVLDAERGSVFLYDEEPNELYTVVATGASGIRIPASAGIVGEAATTRQTINVPDAYADERFNDAVDRQTGFRTRCLLTLPLIGHEEQLVGVLQLLNKAQGVFDERDEQVAEALAAQCAVAIQRAQMTQELVAKERLESELALARDVQMGFLPTGAPELDGYELAGLNRPADETGGDAYDLIPLDDGRVAILLADATGHGLAPALSVTQVRSMLRIGLRVGADLDVLQSQINAQLVEDLASNRFVTAFLGILDAETHRVVYHAPGQYPLMHYHAASGEFEWREATTMPLGLFAPPVAPSSAHFDLEPGDILGLVTDGVYEREDPAGEQFETEGVEEVVREGLDAPLQDLAERLLEQTMEYGNHAPAADDITIVMVRRSA